MNISHIQLNKRAAGDCNIKLVTKTSNNARIVAYCYVNWPIEGTVSLKFEKCKGNSLIKANLVKCQQFCVIWGCKAIIRLVWWRFSCLLLLLMCQTVDAQSIMHALAPLLNSARPWGLHFDSRLWHYKRYSMVCQGYP